MDRSKKPSNYDDLPLVLDVADLGEILRISRSSAYALAHQPGFPAFRSGNRIKVSKQALFDWMARGGNHVETDKI